ncbi:hypothetical protein LOZ58_002880 [Ophidiomyces ophidiicola]|nr:hypothetical protein LOZ58_002880 [Ophidiomyces ophidiicola]
MSPSRSEIISSHPIGDRLEGFRNLYRICQPLLEVGTSPLEEGDLEDSIKTRVLDFLLVLPTLPACHILLSVRGPGALYTDVLRLAANFEIIPLLPLLKAVHDKEPDEIIWDKAATGSFANSSELLTNMDPMLREELGTLHVDIPQFYDAFFGDIPELQANAQAVFERCKEGEEPMFCEGTGWSRWPEGAKEASVLAWLTEIIDKVIQFSEEHTPNKIGQKRPLAQPHKPLKGSTAQRTLDIGFMEGTDTLKNGKYSWSQILIPGELKNNPKYETQSRLDLGRSVREVLAAQDSRLFVPGFTLCGSLIRLWHFDRLGGIASELFNIHEEGLRFVSVILRYLLMTEEDLGFDSTIITANGSRYIKIERDGREERLVVDKVVRRVECISGRATTCWRTHRDGGEPRATLVVKDSWQYPEREEEGELLRGATEKGVVNVARYYHHETVRVQGRGNDICNSIRRGLDITTASNYTQAGSRPPLSRSGSRKGESSQATSRKRSSTCVEPLLPPSKRKQSQSPPIPNRVHRRVIVRDYGKRICMASSRVALLAALEGCIMGYESLHQAGMLQEDISPNNVMINEDKDSAS